MSRRYRWRWAVGVALVVMLLSLAIQTPEVALRGLDPAALTLLPPLSRVPAFVAVDGTLLPIAGSDPSRPGVVLHDQEVGTDSVSYRRGPRRVTIARDQLQLGSDGLPRHEQLFFWLGTDVQGRGLLRRMIYGARTSLLVATSGILGAALLAVIAGLVGAVAPRWISLTARRCGDAMLAVPLLLVALALSSVLRPGPAGIAAILAATGWPAMARLIRAEIVSITTSDLWTAALASGASRVRAAWHHLLPHALGVLIVAVGMRLGGFLLLESSLSFIGFGVAPPEPSWGNILADGRGVLFRAWWVATFPGLSIGLAVLAANAVADRLRGELNPSGS